MVVLLIPALVTGLGIIIGIVWIFCSALADTVAPRRHVPANDPIPGFIVPKWGAYHRGQVEREKALWEEDFERALPK